LLSLTVQSFLKVGYNYTIVESVLLRNGNVRESGSGAASAVARILRTQSAADLRSHSTEAGRPRQERKRHLAVGQTPVHRSSVS